MFPVISGMKHSPQAVPLLLRALGSLLFVAVKTQQGIPEHMLELNGSWETANASSWSVGVQKKELWLSDFQTLLENTLENTSAEVLPLKYLNYPKNYPENLFLFIKTNFPLDGFIYQGRAPLPTGFLGYLTFPSIFKEENKKKYKKRGNDCTALAALI